MKVKLMTAAVTVLLAGCSGVTGLMDASDNFGCPASSGVNCTTLSATYERVQKEEVKNGEIRIEPPVTISSEVRETRPGTEDTLKVSESKKERTAARAMEKTRIGESVIELFILPWVDDQGDLHGLECLMVRVEDARWKIERLRTEAMAGLEGGL